MVADRASMHCVATSEKWGQLLCSGCDGMEISVWMMGKVDKLYGACLLMQTSRTNAVQE